MNRELKAYFSQNLIRDSQSSLKGNERKFFQRITWDLNEKRNHEYKQIL